MCLSSIYKKSDDEHVFLMKNVARGKAKHPIRMYFAYFVFHPLSKNRPMESTNKIMFFIIVCESDKISTSPKQWQFSASTSKK